MRAIEQFGHWAEVRRDFLRAVDCLSDDELGFVPREGLWSAGEVICHVAGAEDGWMQWARGEASDGVEYRASDYPTVGAIKGLLARVHEPTLATLRDLDTADFSREIVTPWGERCAVGWVIWHVLEHEIHHRGEIYLMIGLLGREAPDI